MRRGYLDLLFEMLEPKTLQMILEEIYQKHLSQLKYLDVHHKKLVICFSGIPSSGKTTLAKKIEEKYRGVRITNDEVREIIREVMEKHKIERNEERNQEILHDYLAYFLRSYEEKNKLIILDSGIERSYKEKFSLLQERGYALFVILLEIPLRIIHERLKEREERKPEKNFERLKKWMIDFDSAKKEMKADFTIWENLKKEEERLFQELDKIIL